MNILSEMHGTGKSPKHPCLESENRLDLPWRRSALSEHFCLVHFSVCLSVCLFYTFSEVWFYFISGSCRPTFRACEWSAEWSGAGRKSGGAERSVERVLQKTVDRSGARSGRSRSRRSQSGNGAAVAAGKGWGRRGASALGGTVQGGGIWRAKNMEF